jgi:hypothetical protein
MKLQEAIKQNIPLVVEHPIGGTRYAAEMFVTLAGVVFFDIGWHDSSSHPVHLITGKPVGDGPWRVGDSIIREIEPSDSVNHDKRKWDCFRRSDEGKKFTRELAEKYMCECYGWP